jgi:hypothetical protein
MVSSSSAVVTSAVDDSRRLIGSPVRRLVLGSALMLFLELALIRWLGANIVHLSYFTNFVLLGSFLGIGVGFLISRKTWSLLPWSPVVLAVLVVAVLALPVSIDRAGDDVIFFTALDTTGPPAWLALPVVFVLSALILAGPAEVAGRSFRETGTADGVPVGLGRIVAWHRCVLRAVLRLGSVLRVGVADRAGLHPAHRWPAALAGRRGGARAGGGSDGGVALAGRELVAVLQGRDP